MENFGSPPKMHREEIKMREEVIDLEDRDRGPVCKYVNTPKEETKA